MMKAKKEYPFAKYGERLKQELEIQAALRGHYTQKELARELCCTPECVSNYTRGVVRPKDETYIKLASLWGVRLEYLKCIDDFRTDHDMIEYTNKEHAAKIAALTNMLRAFGYTCNKYVALHVDDFELLYTIWDDLQETLADEELTRNRDVAALRDVSANDVRDAVANKDLMLCALLSRSRYFVRRKIQHTNNKIIRDGHLIAHYALECEIETPEHAIFTYNESLFDILLYQIAGTTAAVVDGSIKTLNAIE